MTIMSSISSRYADAVASLAKAVVEVKTFKPDYEEECLVSEGALGNDPEQPGLVAGIRTTVLLPVTLQMLWNPVGKVFACSSVFCNMLTSRAASIANTNGHVSDYIWPNQRRRTFVMSYLNRERIPHGFVMSISYALRQLGAITRILLPTPALSTHQVSTFAGHGEGNYGHLAVLSVASPKFRGVDEVRQNLEFSGGQTIVVNEPSGKQAANTGKVKRDRSNDWKTSQLWVDAITYGHIQDLVKSVEAKGPSELVRRALRAREAYHLEDSSFTDTVEALQANQDERLNITLPPQSWERVERLKASTGKSFRTLVYEAVLIFAELHERSKDADADGREGSQICLY